MVAPGPVLVEIDAVARRPVWDPRLLGAGLVLVVLLLLGALVIAWVDRWRRRPSQVRLDPRDQLAHFRTLYEDGEISAEEFNRIRGLLTERMMKEMDVAAAPPGEPEAQALQKQSPTENTPG
jgi:hypothetical protein